MSTLLSVETLKSNEECSIFALTRALTWEIYGEKKSCGGQPLCGQLLSLSTQALLFAQVVQGVQVCTLLAHQRKPVGNITQCKSGKQVWLLLFAPPARLSPVVTWNLALRVLLHVVSGASPPMHTIGICWLETVNWQNFAQMKWRAWRMSSEF